MRPWRKSGEYMSELGRESAGIRTCKLNTAKARRALSLIPDRLTRVKMTRTIIVPTKAGNGSETSPAR